MNLSIYETQYNNNKKYTQHNNILLILMLSVIMMNVVMLSGVRPEIIKSDSLNINHHHFLTNDQL